MTTKLVVLTTDGESREDGNVYYAEHVLVSSDTLAFDEQVFTKEIISVSDIEGIADDNDADMVDTAKLIEHIRSLGYAVETPDTVSITSSC